MDEYISLQAVLDIASQYCPDDDGSCSKADVDLREMLDEIEALPTADVYPVKQWISIKDRLPDEDDCYLVVIESEICVSIDIAEYSKNRWHKHDKVLYWQPLPELPKDGDSKC